MTEDVASSFIRSINIYDKNYIDLHPQRRSFALHVNAFESEQTNANVLLIFSHQVNSGSISVSFWELRERECL